MTDVRIELGNAMYEAIKTGVSEKLVDAMMNIHNVYTGARDHAKELLKTPGITEKDKNQSMAVIKLAEVIVKADHRLYDNMDFGSPLRDKQVLPAIQDRAWAVVEQQKYIEESNRVANKEIEIKPITNIILRALRKGTSAEYIDHLIINPNRLNSEWDKVRDAIVVEDICPSKKNALKEQIELFSAIKRTVDMGSTKLDNSLLPGCSATGIIACKTALAKAIKKLGPARLLNSKIELQRS